MEFPTNMEVDFPMLPWCEDAEPVPKGIVCDAGVAA